MKKVFLLALFAITASICVAQENKEKTVKVDCLVCATTGKMLCTCCGGTGTQMMYNDYGFYYVKCPCCSGAGKVTCAYCGGKGYTVVNSNVPVYIPITPTQNNNTNTQSSRTYTETCSRCGGTGEVIASGTSYVIGTKWCEKCGKEVPAGHYHTTCPSCGGSGTITKTR
ncbi:MAG: hypothetical protein FWD60_06745 [Candidatus Azobacteroides sp.]|nr:hypothetical protein [Candidatus Azobacteroides sp.]